MDGAFFKDVNQHSNEAKMASMRFHDILPKEQLYGLLWGNEFDIKRMQTKKGQSYYVTHLTNRSKEVLYANRMFYYNSLNNGALTTKS